MPQPSCIVGVLLVDRRPKRCRQISAAAHLSGSGGDGSGSEGSSAGGLALASVAGARAGGAAAADARAVAGVGDGG